MPSSSIEALGRLISRQVAGHPGRARALLRTAYTLVGVQMKHFPPKNVLPARCAMQGDTARSMAAALGRPGQAACVNIFLPCEVLHALNIPPVLPEGLSCYLVSTAAERVFVEAAEERGVPESYCSYHKILLGLAETGVMARPRFILNTSLACDANQLTFRRLAEFWDVPRFTVDVPYAPLGGECRPGGRTAPGHGGLCPGPRGAPPGGGRAAGRGGPLPGHRGGLPPLPVPAGGALPL